jgi:hypothetical protein
LLSSISKLRLGTPLSLFLKVFVSAIDVLFSDYPKCLDLIFLYLPGLISTGNDLSISRVDLKEGFIRLKSEDTKTGNGRSIPIHSELLEILKNALRVRHLNCDLVFHRNGNPILLPMILEWPMKQPVKRQG